MFSSGYTPGGVAKLLSEDAVKLEHQNGGRLADLFSQSALPVKSTVPTLVITPPTSQKKKKRTKDPIDDEETRPVKKEKKKRKKDADIIDDEETTPMKKEKKNRKKDTDIIDDEETRPMKKEKRKRKKESNPTDDAETQPIKKKKSIDCQKKLKAGKKESSKKNHDSESEDKKEFKNDPMKDARTVFVGNMPTSVTKKVLMNLFKPFGSVESVRFRSAAVADPKMSKKAAVIKKEFHPQKQTINGYVVFSTEEEAITALKMNATEISGFHIRVDRVTESKNDHRHSVFIGNVPFDCREEQIREHFTQCGPVSNVRMIRDQQSGLGKGFGYVLFEDVAAVGLALRLDERPFLNRKLRVSRSTENPQRQPHKHKQLKQNPKFKPQQQKEGLMKKKKPRHRNLLKEGQNITNVDTVKDKVKRGNSSLNRTTNVKQVNNKAKSISIADKDLFTGAKASTKSKKQEKRTKLKKWRERKKKTTMANILQANPKGERSARKGAASKERKDGKKFKSNADFARHRLERKTKKVKKM